VSGGGDECEAVNDAFKATNELKWSKNSMKFVFHIADAPPHGMKYHIGSGDIFPLGCPCKIDLD
jgi:hypothetical protein